MKPFILSALTAVFILSSCSTLSNLGIKPSALETVMALKEILNSSTFKAISKLQKLATDNPAAALPSELQPVLASLKTLGYGSEIDKVTKQVGLASTLVLAESEGIIKDAIKEVDFGDAVAVVTGGPDAATHILKNNMKLAVKKRYSLRLEQELSKSDVDVKTYWPMAASAYNLFSKNKVDGSLTDFMADKAVDAVFLSMGQEEKEIRKDYKSLGLGVVNKVFDYYSTKKSPATTTNRTKGL